MRGRWGEIAEANKPVCDYSTLSLSHSLNKGTPFFRPLLGGRSKKREETKDREESIGGIMKGRRDVQDVVISASSQILVRDDH